MERFIGGDYFRAKCDAAPDPPNIAGLRFGALPSITPPPSTQPSLSLIPVSIRK